MNFPEDSQSNTDQLRKGEAVTVIGASHRRGHLLVESLHGVSLHVPFQYMELAKCQSPILTNPQVLPPVNI